MVQIWYRSHGFFEKKFFFDIIGNMNTEKYVLFTIKFAIKNDFTIQIISAESILTILDSFDPSLGLISPYRKLYRLVRFFFGMPKIDEQSKLNYPKFNYLKICMDLRIIESRKKGFL